MNVFELFATLGIDTTQYDEGLTSAEQKGSQFGQTLGTVVATGGKIAVGAMAATATAAIAGTAAFVNGIDSVAEYGNEIDKMSQKMNMSAESYQEWAFIMEHTGTSIESMKASIKTLSSAAETGSEAFDQLGLSQEEIATMSGEELFAATIEALQGVEDETERTYLAGKLLGKGATELGPLLNLSAEEVEEMREQVHELGGIMSDEAVKAAAQYEDSMQNMKVALSGVKNTLLSEFLPAFSTVMDGLAAVFSGDDSGLALINEGVNDFIENLNEVAPKALEIGANILESLITAISSNLPSLLAEGGNVISELLQGIILALPSLLESAIMIIGQVGSALLDNLPLLFSTALQLVLMLANAITENAPVVIPAIITVVKEIITTLTQPDTLSQLISAALQLILALAEGLLLAIPDLVSIIPIYYSNLIQTMIAMFPEILNAVLVLLGDLGAAIFGVVGGLLGMNFEQIATALTSIGNYISDAFSKITNWFANLSTTLTSTVSSMWENIVNFFVNGLADAQSTVNSVLTSISDTFTSIFDGVKDTVEGAINFIKDLFNFEWSLPDIKLPHFSISGQLDLLATPPTYPSVSVDWYKKGYSDAYILSGATIFGAQGGSLLGAGEGAGSEVVVGTNKLISMMSEAVREAIGSGQTTIIPVYIGNEKIDELVVKSNQRTDYISGGR